MIVGRYRIERELGRGGMGIVYEASQVGLERRVAVKLLSAALSSDAAFVERFKREGRLQASLEHPHVVPVYDAGESEHGLYIAMALVRGPTLAELVIERELDGARTLRLLGQVAGALDAAHAAGLVHRDVKPHNVLVGPADHAYLADFGLTRLGASDRVTTAGAVVGTLAYLAPELVDGRPATPASDRYAFAAMAFECLAGDVVFPRASDAAVLYAHASEPPPRISRRRPELTEAVDEPFAAALAKEPARRPAGARELVGTVESALGPELIAALGPPPARSARRVATTEVPEEPPPGRRTRPGLRALLPAALVGALAGAGLVLAIGAMAGDDDDDRGDGGAPPLLAGAQVLGSDLDPGSPARSLDCRGGRPRDTSPACSVTQAALPGRTLVAPQAGVIRRWGVRGARGELALQVLRKREGKTYQVAAAPAVVLADTRTHLFDTELQVERGDFIGLKAVEGSAVGVRPGVAGATTERWQEPLGGRHRPPDLAAGTGFDHELLLRAEYIPGASRRAPQQVNGEPAAALPAGEVIERGRIKFADGNVVDVALVEIGGKAVLDLFRAGERVARTDLPGFRSGGRVIYFEALASAEEAAEDEGNVYIEYVNPNSTRILDHYLLVHARDFVLTQ